MIQHLGTRASSMRSSAKEKPSLKLIISAHNCSLRSRKCPQSFSDSLTYEEPGCVQPSRNHVTPSCRMGMPLQLALYQKSTLCIHTHTYFIRLPTHTHPTPAIPLGHASSSPDLCTSDRLDQGLNQTSSGSIKSRECVPWTLGESYLRSRSERGLCDAQSCR